MMRRIALRGAGVVALAMVLLLAGCAAPIFRVKVVNESNVPLTSLRLIPVFEDAQAQADAFDAAINLLPRDGDNVTIPVGPGKTTLLPHLLESGVYWLEATFFEDGEFRVLLYEQQYTFISTEKSFLVTVTVQD